MVFDEERDSYLAFIRVPIYERSALTINNMRAIATGGFALPGSIQYHLYVIDATGELGKVVTCQGRGRNFELF
jgi:hypothetical protein